MNLAQVILASTSSGNGSFIPPSPGSNSPPNTAGVTYPAQGTPADPGNGSGTPNPATTGLIRKAYLGQWSVNGQDNFPGIFNGSPFDTQTGDAYIAFGTQTTGDNYCMEWKGFFKANATADWNFRIDADDVGIFWIGSPAINPNNSNWTCTSQSNSGLNYNSVSLVQNTWYPIRVRYQEWGGAESLNIYGAPANSEMIALYQYGWASFMYNYVSGGY